MRLAFTRLAACVLLVLNNHALATETRIPDPAVKTAGRLRNKALADGTAYRIVNSPTTTEIGSRVAGGGNDERGSTWAIGTFKALGYDKVYPEAVTYPLWQRRSERNAIETPFA